MADVPAPEGAPVSSCFIRLLLATLESTGDAGRLLLRYQRDAIFAGEWWRLITPPSFTWDGHTLL